MCAILATYQQTMGYKMFKTYLISAMQTLTVLLALVLPVGALAVLAFDGSPVGTTISVLLSFTAVAIVAVTAVTQVQNVRFERAVYQ